MAGAEAPVSLLLVHGAGSGPWVYAEWPSSFPALAVSAVDLQAGLAVEHASMSEYADAVVVAAAKLAPPVAVCGWSMGGLVVAMALQRMPAHSVVLLEPSAPAEILGYNLGVPLVHGTFDPELEYGAFPNGIQARPESLLARSERKRGISVTTLPCRSLVISSSDFPDERGTAVAALYESTLVKFPDLGHFDLVLHKAPRRAVAEFLRTTSPAAHH